VLSLCVVYIVVLCAVRTCLSSFFVSFISLAYLLACCFSCHRPQLEQLDTQDITIRNLKKKLNTDFKS
jgi:hypothetical protein